MARFAICCACEVLSALDERGSRQLRRNARRIVAREVGNRNPLAACKLHWAGAQNDPKKADEYRYRNGPNGIESNAQTFGLQPHVDFPAAKTRRSTGSFRKRTPVAANSALTSAGAAAAVPGSPMPPGAATLRIK